MVAALTRASALDLTAAAGFSPAGRELPSRRTERAWVRDAQAGSPEAMEALFRAHWGRAHRAAYLIVHDAAAAEDIAQEALLAAIRALNRFDRRRPFGPGCIESWSTGRSTGRGPASCAARCPSPTNARRRRRTHPFGRTS